MKFDWSCPTFSNSVQIAVRLLFSPPTLYVRLWRLRGFFRRCGNGCRWWKGGGDTHPEDSGIEGCWRCVRIPGEILDGVEGWIWGGEILGELFFGKLSASDPCL